MNPPINWTTLGPPLGKGLEQLGGFKVLSPPPVRTLGDLKTQRQFSKAASGASSIFWMQLSSRPAPEIMAASMLAGRRPYRATYVIDAWPYVLHKVGLALRLQMVDTCFVAFREGYDRLKELYPRQHFVHLPFGFDAEVFKPRAVEKDIFCFWMGRRHELLHQAILAYCERHNLRYEYSRNGQTRSPEELGEMVSRSQYFVVTSPSVDHPERAGGFSPMVMRYLEGLAAGTRLLGVVPSSGEYDELLPRDGILEVAADGSDLAERLDQDRADPVSPDRQLAIAREVHERHSWTERARVILEHLPS